MTHDELIDEVSKWLNKYPVFHNFNNMNDVHPIRSKCSFVVCEVVTVNCHGTPDIIGWDETRSVLVECKTSRSDFRAEKKKHVRRKDMESLGIGGLRYYATPKGLLKLEEIPENWGLIEVDETISIKKLIPFGTVDAERIYIKKHATPIKEYNVRAEMSILMSVIKRNRIKSGRVKAYGKKPE